MGNGSDVELILLTSNSCIHLSKTQGFATPPLKIGPEGLVASDISLCAVAPGLLWLADGQKDRQVWV